MGTSGTLTQQHQHRAHTGYSWGQIDIRIKVVRCTESASEIMKSPIEALHPLTQFSAQSIKV
jgi:hypothetical protein